MRTIVLLFTLAAVSPAASICNFSQSDLSGTCSVAADPSLSVNYSLMVSTGLNETGFPLYIPPSTFAPDVTPLYTVEAQLSVQTISGSPVPSGWADSTLTIDLDLPAASGNWLAYGIVQGTFANVNTAAISWPSGDGALSQDEPASYSIPHQPGEDVMTQISLSTSLGHLRTSQEATLIMILGDPPGTSVPEPTSGSVMLAGFVGVLLVSLRTHSGN